MRLGGSIRCEWVDPLHANAWIRSVRAGNKMHSANYYLLARNFQVEAAEPEEKMMRLTQKTRRLEEFMKLFKGLMMGSMITFSALTHATPPTLEQVIIAVKGQISQVLSQSGYRLVDGSINLEPYHVVDGVRIMWNNTYGIAVGQEYFRFYSVDFQLNDVQNRIVPAKTYLIVDDYQKNCAAVPMECSNIYRGLLTQNQVPPSLKDFINTGGQ